MLRHAATKNAKGTNAQERERRKERRQALALAY